MYTEAPSFQESLEPGGSQDTGPGEGREELKAKSLNMLSAAQGRRGALFFLKIRIFTVQYCDCMHLVWSILAAH